MFKLIQNYKRLCKALLSPNVMYDSVLDIQADHYYERGFRNIFLDIDNTVIDLKSKRTSMAYEKWIKNAKKQGFRIYVVSNNLNWVRIQRVAKQLELTGFYFAAKPLPFSGHLLTQQYKLNIHDTLVIGDQVLTDVIFGNWLGAYTILVDPVDPQLTPIKTVQKNIETQLLRWIGLQT